MPKIYRKLNMDWRDPEARRLYNREYMRWYRSNVSGYRERAAAAERKRRQERRQVGTCPICGSEAVRLVRDHCHLTDRYRGHICNRCNLALGLVKDRAETLRRLARYVEETVT